MITAVLLLVADLAIGAAAWKMAKSNTQTNATLLSLLTQQQRRIDDHEVRIVVLEKVRVS
jgi:hypothetical protein